MDDLTKFYGVMKDVKKNNPRLYVDVYLYLMRHVLGEKTSLNG